MSEDFLELKQLKEENAKLVIELNKCISVIKEQMNKDNIDIYDCLIAETNLKTLNSMKLTYVEIMSKIYYNPLSVRVRELKEAIGSEINYRYL